MGKRVNTPQVRFEGYTDAWEQQKFEDIVIRKSKTDDDPNLPNVEYEDIVSNLGCLNKNLLHKPGGKRGIKFEAGDVLYGKLRPYLHNWLLPSFSGLAIGDFWVLYSENVEPNFLYKLIQTDLFDQIANQSTGTRMPRADWKTVSSAEFAIPEREEQQKIGAFFQQIDSAISLYQSKYEKLQLIKTALWNLMYPQEGYDTPKEENYG